MHRLILFVALLATASCQSPNPAEQRVAQLSAAYCECTAKLVALDREAQAIASDSTRQNELASQLRQMQQEYDRARNCLSPVLAQLQPVTAEEVRQVAAQVATQCPGGQQADLLRELLGR